MQLFDILNFQVLDADSCDSRYDDLILTKGSHRLAMYFSYGQTCSQ